MAGDNSLRAALASAAAHLRAGELYNVCTGSAVGKGCRRGQEAHRADSTLPPARILPLIILYEGLCVVREGGRNCRAKRGAHRAGKGFCTEGLPSAGSFLYGQPLPQEDW
jgi:hypothetical protein